MSKQDFVIEFIAHNCKVDECYTGEQIKKAVNYYIILAEQKIWKIIRNKSIIV